MDNLSAVESIFFAALDRSTADRAGYLDQACGQDADLRRRVERLLEAHPKAGKFLDGPATVEERPLAERPGTVIGSYRLMEQLGEGGMGLVFVAEQTEPVRRKVALKVIKPGMDTREVIARFEAERQALALMDHPNIARVFDAGATETGRPYFVMELVKGVPITEYCDAQQLTPRERLELFLPVCQAVQHAHQKGIIHRDLKPSNILVSLHDGTPVVKVIDFGVAKAIGQQLSDKTIYTRIAQLIGTPLYMSPEQAGMSALDVDTRSDIFALGVLLYELLTGTTPFDPRRLQQAAFDEIRRIIREEDPPPPSTRLSTLGDSLASVSAKRRMEPRKLSGLLRGDLDWIVMKALEKDRTRRYDSAAAFAADVRRYLAEEPVEARPPSVGYRMWKFTRRHRTAVAVAMSLVLGLLLVVLSQAISFVHVMAARDQARAEAERALYAERQAQQEQEAAVAAGAAEKAQRARAEEAREKLRRNLYDVEMSLLQPAWEANNLARFDQLLQRDRPGPGESDLRTFEWHYWDRLRHSELRSVTLAGAGRLGSPPVFSADGTRIAAVAVADGQGKLCVWDTGSGKVLHTLLGGLEVQRILQVVVVEAAFSLDGRRLAASRLVLKDANNIDVLVGVQWPADARREVRVWDLASGKLLLEASVAASPAFAAGLALSPDGRTLAIATQVPTDRKQPGRLHLWDVDAGKETGTHALSSSVTALAFRPDGLRLAAALAHIDAIAGLWGTPDAAQEHKVQVWDVASWKETMTVQHPNKRAPRGLAFGPEGRRLAVVWAGPQKQNTLALYDAARPAPALRMIDGVTGTHPVFSPEGSRVTCDAPSSPVRLWDTATGGVLLTARGHEKTPAVSFDATGSLLWTAGMDGTVKEWEEPTQPPAPAGIEDGSNFSPVGWALGKDRVRPARAFRGSDDAPVEVRVWDNDEGKYRVPVKLHADRVYHVERSADGRRLAADYFQAKAKVMHMTVWNADSGQELFRAPDGSFLATGLKFSPDGHRIAWAHDKRVLVWDLDRKGKLLDVEDSWTFLMFLAFSPDGRRLAWASDRRVRVWDIETASETLVLRDPGGTVGTVVFSPDGRRLAGCVGNGLSFTEVKAWDAVTGQELFSLKGEQPLEDLVYSPDGRRLATLSHAEDKGARQCEIKLWDAEAGLLLLRLTVPGGGERRVQFTPDGQRLLLLNRFPSRAPNARWREIWDGQPRDAQEPVHRFP